MFLPTLGVTTSQEISKTNINLDIFTAQVQPKEEPKTIQHTVVEGDNLSTIAKQYNTTWQRLWQQNTQLTNQDNLNVGEKLVIPPDTAVLADRPLYTLPVAETRSEPIKNAPQTVSTPGNSYEAGQCVWFIKNMRPEIPNNWGSAVSWFANARAQGWPTGTVPRVGAVGWTSGHVVLITSVNSNGTVSYTDMNGRWVAFEVGTGTKPASDYLYIY